MIRIDSKLVNVGWEEFNVSFYAFARHTEEEIADLIIKNVDILPNLKASIITLLKDVHNQKYGSLQWRVDNKEIDLSSRYNGNDIIISMSILEQRLTATKK